MSDLRSSLHALLGPWAGDRPAPLPEIPDGLPRDVRAVAQQAVEMLAHYQGVTYARLYLHRLQRFIGRRDLDGALFVKIAAHMAVRMAYQDPVRIAQLILDEPLESAPKQRVIKFRFDDLIEPLPGVFADVLLSILDRLGWRRRAVTLRYYPHSLGGRARLRCEAGLRHWRGLSRHARRERVWVERWLHMIDRALTKQPAAAPAIIETATMIRGNGEPYRQGLADWHLVIDTLAKPTFDGHLPLTDLGAAIAEARSAAEPDPQQRRLKLAIAAIIERVRHAG